MTDINDNNEAILEQTLNQYKDEVSIESNDLFVIKLTTIWMQLSLVVSGLELDQTNEELIELRDKLIEIIAISEGLHSFS